VQKKLFHSGSDLCCIDFKMRRLDSEQTQQLLLERQKILLLDVREKWEFDICHIQASRNIPMGNLPELVQDLDPDTETVVICHHGARSLQVAHYLENNGFNNVINLEGGLDAWARTVDPTMQQY
jgi:rhodanese-related sulfurtransferase